MAEVRATTGNGRRRGDTVRRVRIDPQYSMKILFVASEATPFIKTGGLADVGGSLPKALAALGHDVRILLPGYQAIAIHDHGFKVVADLTLPSIGGTARLLQSRLPDAAVPVWLVDYPPAYDRPGHPYLDAQGREWYDNAERFAILCRAGCSIAMNDADLDWRPDVVHCNDWQSGLIPALLGNEPERPATVFTIHNLAYQGLFPADRFESLGLPAHLWGIEGLEFYDNLSFIKGGLVFADWITTVSPSYAAEICTPEYGCGLDSLLSQRRDRLTGILNGVDYDVWNPATDTLTTNHFDVADLDGKKASKQDLQRLAGLPADPDAALIGTVGRLVEQKGVDLITAAIPQLMPRKLQFIILGSGEARFEQRLRELADRYPQQLAVFIGYNESLAHQIESGADMFLMPSRFEPCGLNQLYSLRYGTLPIVRSTGGLKDSVVDTNAATLADGTASGIVFAEASSEALAEAVRRALTLYSDPARWRQIMRHGMQQDFSWRRSATRYVGLYRRALAAADDRGESKG